MLTKTRKPWERPWSEVTPEAIYRSRREFLQTAAAGTVGLAAGASLSACEAAPEASQAALASTRNPAYVAPGPLNTFEELTTFNNFYEFGSDKDDPVRYAGSFKPKPWTVTIDGLVNRPGDFSYDEVVKPHALEERIYRFRCVEAWSAVIPWIGFPLADLINRVGPMPSAKYVAFTTVLRPSEMRGQRTSSLDWPYVEGLRMDEAMHPLTLVAVGLYSKALPNQNGAPIRLVVPWKYGFKSIKSIVRISFVDQEPPTSWNIANPPEYGFYSNVNPERDHPRWSQKRERRLGTFLQNLPTAKFNGYGDEVAGLYAGMDLINRYY
jgi:sulfoxide reductase catalytic subunit YedY